MKIHLIKEKSIRNFITLYPESSVGMNEWISKVKVARWKKPKDIQSTFGSADLLDNSSSRVVFDIAGNKFRLICKYAFGANAVHLFVCWIGNHNAYDKLCKTSKQYTINKFKN